MKRIVTVFALAMICSGAFAQFNQGRYLVGGALSLTATTEKSQSGGTTTTVGKNTDFTFTPTFGYFVIDNLAVGAAIDASVQSFKADGSSSKNSASVTTIDPFVRYYLDPGIFFQGRIGFGGASYKNTTGSTTTTSKGSVFSWDIGAGYAYFLTDNVAVEPLIKYGVQSVKAKNAGDSKTTNGGIQFQIGFTIYLGPQK